MTELADLPTAFVLGLSPTGLYVIRELGAAGVPVVGVASERQPGAASRFLKDVIIEPNENRRLDEIRGRARRKGEKPVLIPTSDQDLEFIIRHEEVLAREFVFQASYRDELAARILNKADFYQLCAEYGISYPSLHEVAPDELSALKQDLAFPVMIKPSLIHDIKAEMAGQKGWVARNAEEYMRVIQAVPPHAGTLLVQEIVPGPESEITLFAGYFGREGRVHQPFTCRKLRQYPPGFGSASLVVSETDPETRDLATRFLQALGFQGIAAAEFKRDPRSGELKIIEINPRPSLWFSASTAAGKHVALAAYHDLLGGSLPYEGEQANGIIWRYALKDLYSAIFYQVNRAFVLPPPDITSARSAQRGVWAVFQRDDRAPAWFELFNYVRKGMTRILPRTTSAHPGSGRHGR